MPVTCVPVHFNSFLHYWVQLRYFGAYISVFPAIPNDSTSIVWTWGLVILQSTLKMSQCCTMLVEQVTDPDLFLHAVQHNLCIYNHCTKQSSNIVPYFPWTVTIDTVPHDLMHTPEAQWHAISIEIKMEKQCWKLWMNFKMTQMLACTEKEQILYTEYRIPIY